MFNPFKPTGSGGAGNPQTKVLQALQNTAKNELEHTMRSVKSQLGEQENGLTAADYFGTNKTEIVPDEQENQIKDAESARINALREQLEQEILMLSNQRAKDMEEWRKSQTEIMQKEESQSVQAAPAPTGPKRGPKANQRRPQKASSEVHVDRKKGTREMAKTPSS